MRKFITGDIHGDIGISRLSAHNFPQGKELTKDDLVFICGDFGLLWYPPESKNHKRDVYWLKWLDSKPWTTVFIDGNHENSDIINNLPEVNFYGGKAGKVNDSVYHLKRGEIYNFDGTTILTVGGAVSIDKYLRIEGISWWPEEILNKREEEHTLDNLEKHQYKVDYIITHTAPELILQKKFLPHFGNKMLFGNKYFKDPVAKFLDHIYSNTEYKHWYCGHMHENISFEDITFLFEDIKEFK